jgi:hypothetical protein
MLPALPFAAVVDRRRDTAPGRRSAGIGDPSRSCFGGTSFTLNRFTGPGRLGIQSMTYHQPIVANAGQRSTGIVLGGLLGGVLEGFQ